MRKQNRLISHHPPQLVTMEERKSRVVSEKVTSVCKKKSGIEKDIKDHFISCDQVCS